MFAAVLTAVLWAFSSVFAYRSAKTLGGAEANFWRLTLATCFLGLWAHTFGQGTTTDTFTLFLMSGIIGIGIGDVALFESLPRLGSRLTILLIQCSSTPFAAIIEYFWLGTKIGLMQLMFGGIILVGVAMALKPANNVKIPRELLIPGVLFATLAGLGNAFGAVLSRKGFASAATAGHYIDGGTTAYQRLIGGLFIAGIWLLLLKRKDMGTKETASIPGKWKKVWVWVLANALAGQTFGVTFYQIALKTAPTAVVLPITALTPLVLIPLTRYFENERPHPRSIIGGIIAVGGVIGLILSRV
jgi:drug/metabolite transporter (DMT)-like permease